MARFLWQECVGAEWWHEGLWRRRSACLHARAWPGCLIEIAVFVPWQWQVTEMIYWPGYIRLHSNRWRCSLFHSLPLLDVLIDKIWFHSGFISLQIMQSDASSSDFRLSFFFFLLKSWNHYHVVGINDPNIVVLLILTFSLIYKHTCTSYVYYVYFVLQSAVFFSRGWRRLLGDPWWRLSLENW